MQRSTYKGAKVPRISRGDCAEMQRCRRGAEQVQRCRSGAEVVQRSSRSKASFAEVQVQKARVHLSWEEMLRISRGDSADNFAGGAQSRCKCSLVQR